MKYIKIFSGSQAAIQALNSNIITSTLVKETVSSLNTLALTTEKVEISWIKAHIGHPGNERANQLAREATHNTAIRVNTPPSWAHYKQALKEHIYLEWEQPWQNDNAYRMTNLIVIKLRYC